MDVKRHVKTFLRGIDRMVDVLLDNPSADLMTALPQIKREAGETLRPIMGTSAGWSWLSEYMLFHAFRRTIEETIGSKLEAIEPPRGRKRWVFVDSTGEFVLGHDTTLAQLLNKESSDMFWNQTPDICLVHRKRIMLTVEAKTSIIKFEKLNGVFRKLTSIQERAKKRPRSLAFFISYARSLEAKPQKVVNSYRKFYEAGGRYVGRFDHNLATNPLFTELDSRGRRMKLLRLEDCLKKVKLLLGYLTNV